MCGIAGIVPLRSARHPADPMALHAMVAALRHRGPDDEGVWLDPVTGVALGNRRLAIVDTSPSGHQPMVSSSGRFVLTFNGEVYDHERLRPELAARGHPFSGHSDTAVLLAAVEEWGVDRALARVNGMFAFALWDAAEQRLVLARDRVGEKPLYYAVVGGALRFASELDALVAGVPARPRISRDALAAFVRNGCLPAPLTIYDGIRQLPPGTTATLDVGAGATEVAERRYWSAADVGAGASRRGRAVDEVDEVDELDALLRDAVALRMRCDVPIGAFLSGGIDSSLVVAMMQAESSRTVRTFTIGFDDAARDERGWAGAVARHLGTDHTAMRVDARDAVEVIPTLAGMYGEPFADPSAIPTALLAALARRDVTVVLSGDGGDELFGGYDRYRDCAARWADLQARRRRLRHWVARARGRIPASAPSSREQLYRRARSFTDDPLAVVLGASEPPSLLTDPATGPRLASYAAWMSYVDLVTYLPDFILTKVDRATMAHGLESRAPLLDHRVVESALALPSDAKFRDGQGKWVLRQVLDRYVDRALVERPKSGFDPPLGAWLRTTLRDWAEDLVAEDRLRAEGYLRPEPVRSWWREHLDGADRTYALWSVLMFQSWLTARSPAR